VAEDVTHRTLSAYLDLIAEMVGQHNGHVVHYAGDAVLAKFEAALDALTCATTIQTELASRNAALPADGRVQFRIGLNLGDVIEDRGDIYGDGVNVAARLQALAKPGEICVSESIRVAVGNRLPVAFTDLGEKKLKNIEDPVRAYHVTTHPGRSSKSRPPLLRRLRLGTRRAVYGGVAVLAFAAATVATVVLVQRGAHAHPLTIAVLPLADFSGQAEEYFVDGMTEALIASLARISGLSVISRTSIMRYKGTDKPLPEIGRELGADVIVEGSAQLDGDNVVITAQLIDSATDRHLWAERYERPLRDVLRLQGELAQSIAQEIDVTIEPGESARFAAVRDVDPETYRAYLRAMYHLNMGTPAEVEQGLAYLHAAVDRDPGDALAWAGLALGYATLGHGAEPRADVWPRARAAALRAVTLDPNLAEAYAALADVKLYMEWDWAGAEAAFRRANELNPSLAMNHYHYAWYLLLFGRNAEAIAEHKRAQQLDPLTPLHTLWLGGMYLYQDLGRYEDAIAEEKRALQLDPNNPMALMILARGYDYAGRHDLAIETSLRMVELNPAMKWELGLTYVLAGKLDEARATLEEIEREPPTSWTALGRAVLYAQLGDADNAFKWLDYYPPHAWVPWARVDPWLRPALEKDPRFNEFLERLKLPL
jgi:adenylate cyclase